MTKIANDLESRLDAIARAGFKFSCNTDAKGVTVAWCKLSDRADLLPLATLLKTLDARLSTVTAFQPKAIEVPPPKEGEAPPPVSETPIDGKTYEIAYHFDLDGDTLTLSVLVPVGGAVDSLTGLYRNADWNEREFMEFYNIGVNGHPDPRRLFLDPSIDGAVLERLIPFSTLINSATTKGLWEKLFAQKGSPT